MLPLRLLSMLLRLLQGLRLDRTLQILCPGRSKLCQVCWGGGGQLSLSTYVSAYVYHSAYF